MLPQRPTLGSVRGGGSPTPGLETTTQMEQLQAPPGPLGGTGHHDPFPMLTTLDGHLFGKATSTPGGGGCHTIRALWPWLNNQTTGKAVGPTIRTFVPVQRDGPFFLPWPSQDPGRGGFCCWQNLNTCSDVLHDGIENGKSGGVTVCWFGSSKSSTHTEKKRIWFLLINLHDSADHRLGGKIHLVGV